MTSANFGRGKRKRMHVFVLLIWLALVATLMKPLYLHLNTPGEPAVAPATWPSQSKILRSMQKNTVLVFVHPLCACSKATIAELERLLPKIAASMDVTVVFRKPKNGSVNGRLWTQTKGIPGVTVVEDFDEYEALAFDAKTSGQTVAYARDGRLIFRGGITAGRGHQGDSDGQAALIALAANQQTTESAFPVFGCSLKNPSTEFRLETK